MTVATDPDERRAPRASRLMALRGQAEWMEETIIEIIISEAQNEVRDFKKWGFDIIPHRVVMKKGFETPDGKRVDVEDAFKDPQHPFRVAIVCAMWLTGFDVECLSTLYIDKPMKAHTLMQAIARANRVYPGKDCGLIVDYNGMLKSLREALAQYALGDDDDGGAGGGDRGADRGAGCSLCSRRSRRRRSTLRRLGFDAGTAARREGFRPHRGPARRRGRALHVGRSQAALRDHGAAGVHPLQGAADGAERVRLSPSGTTTSRRSTRS